MPLFLFIFILHITSHSYSKFIRHHSPRFFFFISSSPVSSVGKTSLGCRAKPRIELGNALQQIDALPTDLRRTLWATPHPAELCRNLLSYATTCWATPYPLFTLLAVSTVHEGARHRQAWASYLVCSLSFAAWSRAIMPHGYLHHLFAILAG